jgi:hypothetical protein
MLNKTNITSESCNFLDLDIPPYEGKFNKNNQRMLRRFFFLSFP